mmetsp:Transcript_63020/g.179096  ORF Transcript_63020/g.179096 Transcript_63020/m.179096 type:complete len:335 (+) Transcript_63020:749-1753(+)
MAAAEHLGASELAARPAEEALPLVEVKVHKAQAGRLRRACGLEHGCRWPVEHLVDAHGLVPAAQQSLASGRGLRLPEVHAVGPAHDVQEPGQATAGRQELGQAPGVGLARDHRAKKGLISVPDARQRLLASRSSPRAGSRAGARGQPLHLLDQGLQGLLCLPPATVQEGLRRGLITDGQWPELIIRPCAEAIVPRQLAARAQEVQGSCMHRLTKATVVSLKNLVACGRVLAKGANLVHGVLTYGHLVLCLPPDSFVAKRAGPDGLHVIGEACQILVPQVKMATARQAALQGHVEFHPLLRLALKKLIGGVLHTHMEQNAGWNPRCASRHNEAGV